MRFRFGLLGAFLALVATRSALAQPAPPDPTTEPSPPDASTTAPVEPPPPPPEPAPEAAVPAPSVPAPEDAQPLTPEPSPSDAEAGYFPGEGFVLRTRDKSYRLRIGLQSALRAQMAVNGKARLTNPFMTLRPIVEGNLYRPWLRFWTSLELAANPVFLLDSYVEVQPIDAIGIRVGQQWTPFSRHEAISGPHQLLLPEWSQVSNYFWTGRDKGVTLFGSAAEKKVDYAVGAYMGSPLRQFDTINGNYMFVGRLSVSPLGPVGATEFAYAEKDEPAPFRMAFGVNGFTSKINQGAENFNPSTFQFEVVPTDVTTINHGVGADYILQTSRFTAMVEGYLRKTDRRAGRPTYTSVGGFAQLGVLLYKRELDAAVRVSMADVNLNESHDMAYGLEVASSWYIHGPMAAVKVRYGYGTQMTTPDGQTSGGAPLILSPGPLHIVTAQINTAF